MDPLARALSILDRPAPAQPEAMWAHVRGGETREASDLDPGQPLRSRVSPEGD